MTISSEFLAVDPGYVCGIVQDGVGYRKKRAGDPAAHGGVSRRAGSVRPRSRSTATPRLSVRIAGGIHGDVATAAIVVNSIPKVLDAAPGLHTMRDLPLPSFFAGK